MRVGLEVRVRGGGRYCYPKTKEPVVTLHKSEEKLCPVDNTIILGNEQIS